MSEQKVFIASTEAKDKAKQLKSFVILAWILGIGGQFFTISKLISNETLVWLIVVSILILTCSITDSLLWKKANRLGPAAAKLKFKYFIQNQLGEIIGVLSFLSLEIFTFMNKNNDSITRGIAGTIGAAALVVAGIIGIDFNPSAVEQ